MTDAQVAQYPPPKTTPGRRRQGRSNGKPGGHKAYASENDVASIDSKRQYATDGPHTPHKASYNTDAAARQRSNQKSRNASMNNTSPESGHHGRKHQVAGERVETPPSQHRSASMKATTKPAFAGATFHASPAPGSLPMPSFLARTSAESPLSRQSTQAMQQPSPPATDTDVPTPRRPDPETRSTGSPLDFMFRAHREEMQRRESANGTRPKGLESTPAQSPFKTNSPQFLATDPQGVRPGSRRSRSGIDVAELDGTPGMNIGPAFSTPYQERIKAARGQANPSPKTSEDSAEALKKYLFAGLNNGNAGTHSQFKSTQSSASPSAAPPNAQPFPNPSERRTSIQAMENDLRRILKMDNGGGSGGHGVFTQ